jgi:hypothetical protein
MPRILPVEQSAEAPNPKQISGPRGKAQKKVPLVPKRRFVLFGPPSANDQPEPVVEKPKPVKKPKRRNDPKFVAAARELRDRWLEHANAHPEALGDSTTAKYQISRAIEADQGAIACQPARLLPAA